MSWSRISSRGTTVMDCGTSMSAVGVLVAVLVAIT